MLLSKKMAGRLETPMESLCGPSMLLKQSQPKVVSGSETAWKKKGWTDGLASDIPNRILDNSEREVP